jgi:hypothetical protein
MLRGVVCVFLLLRSLVCIAADDTRPIVNVRLLPPKTPHVKLQAHIDRLERRQAYASEQLFTLIDEAVKASLGNAQEQIDGIVRRNFAVLKRSFPHGKPSPSSARVSFLEKSGKPGAPASFKVNLFAPDYLSKFPREEILKMDQWRNAEDKKRAQEAMRECCSKRADRIFRQTLFDWVGLMFLSRVVRPRMDEFCFLL